MGEELVAGIGLGTVGGPEIAACDRPNVGDAVELEVGVIAAGAVGNVGGVQVPAVLALYGVAAVGGVEGPEQIGGNGLAKCISLAHEAGVVILLGAGAAVGIAHGIALGGQRVAVGGNDDVGLAVLGKGGAGSSCGNGGGGGGDAGLADVLGDVVAVGVIIMEIERAAVNGDDEALALDVSAAGAVLAVAHAARRTVIELDGLGAVGGVGDHVAGSLDLVIHCIGDGVVMAPEKNDRLARSGALVQSVDDQVGVGGCAAPAAPGTAAGGSGMKREVGEHDDGLAVVNGIQVAGKSVDLSLSIIVAAVIPVGGAQSIDPEVRAVSTLGAYDVIGGDGVGGAAELTVVILMVAGGVDRGDVVTVHSVHDGLSVSPEVGLVGAGVAHIAAEAHVIDLAIHIDDVVEPAGKPVRGLVAGLIVDVRGEGENGRRTGRMRIAPLDVAAAVRGGDGGMGGTRSGKGRYGAQREDHAEDDQSCKESFLHLSETPLKLFMHKHIHW